MLVVGRGFCALRHVDYEGVLGLTKAYHGGLGRTTANQDASDLCEFMDDVKKDLQTFVAAGPCFMCSFQE